MDADTNEMECFDFKKQFSVEIINVDEESDESQDIFLPKQEPIAMKPNFEISTTTTKGKKETERQTVLKIIKDQIVRKISDDSIKGISTQQKKKKSNKHKKDKKEDKRTVTSKEKNLKPKKDKKEDKRIVTSKEKDLKPIDEMELVPQSLPSDKPESKKTEMIKEDQSNKLQETNGALNKNGQNDEYHQYINDLLAKVSESLIHILEAYYNHVAILQDYNSKDSRFLSESKRKFTRIKQHFFQLSYCTTNIIILSRESDSQFTEEFLKNTVKLAEEKKRIKLTVQQIQPLYYELISWVKQKKELQNLPLRSVPPSDSLPELRKQLSQPTVSSSISTIPIHVIPKVSILNSNPQNREIRISLDPKSVENTTKILNHPSVQTSQPLNISQFDKTLHPGFHKTGQMYTDSDPLQYYNYQMSRYIDEVRRKDVLGNNVQRPNMSEMTAPTTNLLMNNVANQSKCMAANCSCQYQYQSGVANPMNIRFPSLPSYEQSFIWKNDNMNSNLNNAENNVDTTRSSVSTDSGFISPQQQSSPLENMTPTNEDLQNTVTPLITHVTSLNPRALQIAEGSCHICGLPTKKKCLGCYQIYYCSYQCQRLDWGQHMNLCKYFKSAIRPTTNLIHFPQQ